MTIHLPEDLERYVHEQVRAGRFPSEDDVIFDALQRHRQAQVTPPIGPTREAAGLSDNIVEQAMSDRQEQAGQSTALLAALEEVDEIQQGLNPSKISPTREYLDEARSGGMYGYGDDDGPDSDSN